jgi:hypothetical protein
LHRYFESLNGAITELQVFGLTTPAKKMKHVANEWDIIEEEARAAYRAAGWAV